jgi:hypothetical protein
MYVCRFAKLCRDAGIVDKSFSAAAADLIFTKVKAKVNKQPLRVVQNVPA